MKMTIVWSMWHDQPDLAAEMRINGRDPVAEVTIDVPQADGFMDRTVLEELFEATNLYAGPLWDVIEPVLPERRSHTALSVGDYVVIDGRSYRCDRFGWSLSPRPDSTL